MVSPETLRSRFNYDPETGKIWWKHLNELPPPFQLKCSQEAFTSGHKGYLAGRVDGKLILAHRAAWALYYGKWPEKPLDHINHDRKDNRIANLRECDLEDNARNMSMPRNNTSGVVGVYRRWSGKWSARITSKGKKVGLGTFDSFEEAVQARKKAEIDYGFHPNHGKGDTGQ